MKEPLVLFASRVPPALIAEMDRVAELRVAWLARRFKLATTVTHGNRSEVHRQALQLGLRLLAEEYSKE